MGPLWATHCESRCRAANSRREGSRASAASAARRGAGSPLPPPARQRLGEAQRRRERRSRSATQQPGADGSAAAGLGAHRAAGPAGPFGLRWQRLSSGGSRWSLAGARRLCLSPPALALQGQEAGRCRRGWAWARCGPAGGT